MIKLISSKAARYLCSNETDTDSLELYEYAIYVVLSSIFHIATIVVLGVFFNMIIESVVFYFSFISIRKFAGGYHAKTPTKCYLFSILSNIIILYFIKLVNGVSVIFIFSLIMFELFCVVLILLISPLDTENNPLKTSEKKMYRIIAVFISILIFIISTWCVFTGYRNMGCSMICGVIMSTLVLLMRKFQIIFEEIKKSE
nr:accessory gene regulator B family protein [Ruminococcus bromii]